MNCIYLKQKLNKTLQCKYLKKDINISNCNGCKYKEYKVNNYKIKQRTPKQNKIERNRFSIITSDLNHCIICGNKKDHLHEVFYGTSRQLSMKYGLVIPLCTKCHLEMHKNKDWQDYWHIKGQQVAMKHYKWSINDFRNIFGKNYIKE